MNIILSLFLFVASLFLPCARAEETLKNVFFIPQWSPQAQFAGYYVAYEKGIYRKYGINLNILPGGPSSPSAEFLEKGKVDFATMWLSTAIQKRSQGLKLVNIAQIIQRSALMLIAKKARGINRPEDIDNKKVGIWGEDFKIQPTAFFKKYKLKVKVIPQSYSVNLFLRDGVDVASAMWYNEYHTILNAGLNPDELTTFFFHEHGLNFPEDGIYCRASLLEKEPALCRAFVEATLEGWMYAFEHQDEAVNIVVKYSKEAKIPVNRTHQRWMMARMKDLLLPEGNSQIPTHLSETGYQLVVAKLFKNGFIHKKPLFSEISKPVIK